MDSDLTKSITKLMVLSVHTFQSVATLGTPSTGESSAARWAHRWQGQLGALVRRPNILATTILRKDENLNDLG